MSARFEDESRAKPMPYIEQERREKVASGDIPRNAGELNYLLTITALRKSKTPDVIFGELRKICRDYIAHHGLRYQYINDVMGALSGAYCEMHRRGRAKLAHRTKLFGMVANEFYTNVAAGYENTKIIANGDFPY